MMLAHPFAPDILEEAHDRLSQAILGRHDRVGRPGPDEEDEARILDQLLVRGERLVDERRLGERERIGHTGRLVRSPPESKSTKQQTVTRRFESGSLLRRAPTWSVPRERLRWSERAPTPKATKQQTVTRSV